MDETKYKFIAAGAVLAASFCVYLLTLAPTVWFIDSGELSAVASTLGIAHPTGYPLFTIIGNLFTRLPISSSEVYNLNVMSALFCSLGLFIFYFLIAYSFSKQVISSPVQDKHKKGSSKKGTAHAEDTGQAKNDFVTILAIPAAASLILAFSKTFWGTANSVEVYPIHVFFLILLSLIFLKAIFDTAASTGTFFQQNKYYLLFALFLGLSFTNHLTTILLAPACLTIFLNKNLSEKKRLYKLLGWMSVCFIIGLSLYIYLPIRANMEPTFLWGNPYNFERFRWHVTGKQFSVWIFSAQGSIAAFIFLIGAAIATAVYGLIKRKSLNQNIHFFLFIAIAVLGYILIKSSGKIVVQQFDKFTESLWMEFGIGFILISIAGVYYLSRFNITIFYYTFLAFFGCLFYSVNYDIHDIYSYFLLSYITIGVWIAFGFLYIYRRLKEYLNTQGKKIIFSIIIILLAVVPLKTHYQVNDESKNYYVEDLTMNVFMNAEPNSIIISSQWDFWVSASWYFKYVKKMRPDLIVIDRELMRRSWYYTFLQRNYPEIYNNSKAEIERFLIELDKFEHNLPSYDQASIIKAFDELQASFVYNNPARRVYTTWEIEQNRNEQIAKDYGRIPDGLLFRLVKSEEYNKNLYTDYKVHDFKFTPVNKNDYYHETLTLTYAMMLTASANFLISQNRRDDAKKYIDMALTANPNYPQAIEIKRRYNIQ